MNTVVGRAPNWRTNAMQANQVARGLGIETKGKRLAQVVAEIDAQDAQQAATAQQQREEFRVAEAKRTAPGNRARAAAGDSNPFKAFIAKHGIALDRRVGRSALCQQPRRAASCGLIQKMTRITRTHMVHG